jgi:hypothetical protein
MPDGSNLAKVQDARLRGTNTLIGIARRPMAIMPNYDIG